MKILVKTKLIEANGKLYCEIRDYELGKTDLKVIYCVKGKEYKSCYHLGEEFMTLTVAKQKDGVVINTQKSMFPPYAYYKLLRFLWKPKGEVESKQVGEKDLVFVGNTVKLP